MPKHKEGQLPKYRLHKQSGQAVVTISGRDRLLGKDLLQVVKTKKTELPFLALFLRLLCRRAAAPPSSCPTACSSARLPRGPDVDAVTVRCTGSYAAAKAGLRQRTHI